VRSEVLKLNGGFVRMVKYNVEEGMDEWRVETYDDSYPFLWINVFHENNKVIEVVIYDDNVRNRLTNIEIKVLNKILKNYKI